MVLLEINPIFSGFSEAWDAGDNPTNSAAANTAKHTRRKTPVAVNDIVLGYFLAGFTLI